MQNASTLATDPHTGKTYDMAPLFDYPYRIDSKMDVYLSGIHKNISLIPYVFLHINDPVLEVDAINMLENARDLHEVFSQVIASEVVPDVEKELVL